MRPAARSSSASDAVATPSQVEPASSAARAAGTAPWPYPFALTTAQCTAPCRQVAHQPADVVADGLEVDLGQRALAAGQHLRAPGAS